MSTPSRTNSLTRQPSVGSNNGSSPARTTSSIGVRRRRSTGIMYQSRKKRRNSSMNQAAAPAAEEEQYECAICIDTCRLPFITQCKHVFCFLCLKSSLQLSAGGRCCPMCRATIDLRHVESTATVAAEEFLADIDTEYVWRYSGKNNGFWLYDPESMKELERSWMRWKGAVAGAEEAKRRNKEEREKREEEERVKKEKEEEEERLRKEKEEEEKKEREEKEETAPTVSDVTATATDAAGGDSVTCNDADSNGVDGNGDDSTGVCELSSTLQLDDDLDVNAADAENAATDASGAVGTNVSASDAEAAKAEDDDEDNEMDDEDEDMEEEEDYDSEDDYYNNRGPFALPFVQRTVDIDEDPQLQQEVFKLSRPTLSIGGQDYTVDFVEMVQYPANNPTRQRAVQRVAKNETDGNKGVSGIRFVRNQDGQQGQSAQSGAAATTTGTATDDSTGN